MTSSAQFPVSWKIVYWTLLRLTWDYGLFFFVFFLCFFVARVMSQVWNTLYIHFEIQYNDSTTWPPYGVVKYINKAKWGDKFKRCLQIGSGRLTSKSKPEEWLLKHMQTNNKMKFSKPKFCEGFDGPPPRFSGWLTTPALKDPRQTF